MHHKLISGDNHIDLTYLPEDLWSAQAGPQAARPRTLPRSSGTQTVWIANMTWTELMSGR